MKLNLQTAILDFSGRPLPQTFFGIRSNNPVNLGFLIVNILGTSLPGEKELSAEEKVKRYTLATKMLYAEEAEITTDEAALIKKCGNKMLSPMVFGQLDCILEGKPTGIKQIVEEEEETKEN